MGLFNRREPEEIEWDKQQAQKRENNKKFFKCIERLTASIDTKYLQEVRKSCKKDYGDYIEEQAESRVESEKRLGYGYFERFDYKKYKEEQKHKEDVEYCKNFIRTYEKRSELYVAYNIAKKKFPKDIVEEAYKKIEDENSYEYGYD